MGDDALLLAIDPGTTRSAWCELARLTRQTGRIVSFGTDDNERVLEMLRTASPRPTRTTLAVEMVASYGMPVGHEVFQTVLWIGRFLEAWRGPHVLVYRRDVKLHLCKSPRANDAAIRQRLIDLYGPEKDTAIGSKRAPGPLYGIRGDEWQALAVALTAYNDLEQG